MAEKHLSATEQSCQVPVPKPGEPVVWTKGFQAAPTAEPSKAKPSAAALFVRSGQ